MITIARDYNSHTLWDLLFLILIITNGFIGSKLLIWYAPWRVTEIYIAVILSCVGAIGGWEFGRRKPLVRMSLLVGVTLLTIGSIFGLYRVFITHYHKEFPLVYEHVDLGREVSGEGNTTIASKQKKLDSMVRDSQGHRSRLGGLIELWDFLDKSVSNENLLSEADSILNSRYQYYDYEPAQLPSNLDWTEDPYIDRSWNWRLHNMGYIVTLTRAFEKSGDTKYLERAEEIILDWISDNTSYIFEPPSKFSWNDHSTAFRLLNWLYFFDVWKSSDLVDPEKLDTLLRALLGHALLLSDENFYTRNHNHGIDQDRALLAFSLMHPGIGKTRQWQDLALSRLAEQIDFAVSPNGIHLEHSPAYHIYGMTQLQKSLSFLEQWEVEHEVVRKLRGVTQSMAAFVPYLVKPDGYLVQVGDTHNKSITEYQNQLVPFRDFEPSLESLIETGDIQFFTKVARAFPEEGYAVIRDIGNRKPDFRNSFYLFFVAGAHEGRGHRQADDLTFVLSHDGREILVDPGVYSYKHDAGRDYVISTSAHNTVALNGISSKGWDTKLDSFVTEDRYTLFRASHRNYPGFEHTRWLLYLQPTLMFVIDRLQPLNYPTIQEKHYFEQMFHFAPDLHVEIGATDRNVTVFAGQSNSRPVLLLTQLSELKPTMRVAKGEVSPMQGWHSQAHAKLVPAPTLISSLNGINAEYITAVEIPANGEVSQELGSIRRRFRSITEGSVVRIRWAEGKKKYDLRLNLDTNKVSLD